MGNDIYQIIALLFICIVLLTLVWRLRLKKLKTYHSPLLGKIEIYEKYNKELSLTINNYVQGVSINDPSVESSYWGYISSYVVENSKNNRSPRLLMLGLGANTISSLIAKKDPRISQTVVEIDKQIIQACKDFFGLNKTRNIKVINGDAIKLLANNNQLLTAKYDFIIVDIFTGKTPFVVEESNNPKFIKNVVRKLKPDGVLLFNRPGTDPKVLNDNKELENFLKTVFKETIINLIKDPRGYKNSIIIGKIKR